MKLFIYQKKDFLYSIFSEKKKSIIKILNEDLKIVKLYKRNIIDEITINSFEDLREKKDYLSKYKFKIYVIEQKKEECTEIILRLDILNNPFYTALICKKEEKNKIEENKVPVRIINVETLEDWQESEKNFGFKCDFAEKIF